MIVTTHRTIEPEQLGLRGSSFTKELDVTVEQWRDLLDLSATAGPPRTAAAALRPLLLPD